MAETSKDLQTLGGRVAEALRIAGLSQREASLLAGTKHSYAGLLARGRRPRPEAEPLCNLAAVLGVSVEWLLKGEGTGPTPRKAKAAVAKARAARASAAPEAAQ